MLHKKSESSEYVVSSSSESKYSSNPQTDCSFGLLHASKDEKWRRAPTYFYHKMILLLSSSLPISCTEHHRGAAATPSWGYTGCVSLRAHNNRKIITTFTPMGNLEASFHQVKMQSLNALRSQRKLPSYCFITTIITIPAQFDPVLK